MLPRIHLPSNGSIKYFPNNTASNFRVKVPHLFDSKASHSIVECALSQIIFPNSYRNVRDGLNGVLIYHMDENGSEKVQQYHVPPGYYGNIDQLLHAIKEAVPPLGEDVTKEKFKVGIGYDEMKQKTWIRVSLKFFVEFQLDIAKLLGFDANVKIKRSTKEKRRQFSTYNAQVHGGSSTIFVYCDIIQHQLIAETSAPLLRILNWNHMTKKQNVSQTFSELFYIPIKSHDFDTIHIYLLDSMGYPISFEDEHTYATLEFREKDI